MEVSSPLALLLPPFERFLGFLSEEPFVRGVQALLILGSSFLLFLVFHATRDILRRTQSLSAQIGCILLVAAFPLVGFLLYLLVRPQRTLHEKKLEEILQELLSVVKENAAKSKKEPKAPRLPTFPTLARTSSSQVGLGGAVVPSVTSVTSVT
jgi:Na+/melibiose symporter-like transporter